MPFQPCPNIVQVNVHATYLGVPIENVYHVRSNDSPTPPGDLTAIAGLWAEAWVDLIVPYLNDSYTTKEIDVVDLSVEAGGVATDTTASGTVGGVSGDPEPGNVCFCVSLRTGLAGRSFRGRTYLSGQIASEVTLSRLSGARISQYVTGLQTLIDNMAAAFFPLVVLSRRHNGVVRAEGIGTQILTAVSVDDLVDTQRRRLK
jgi:hypothetical protein